MEKWLILQLQTLYHEVMSESPETKIAVLQMQMKNVEKKVDDGFIQINSKMDALTLNINDFHTASLDKFATKDEVLEVKKLATSRLYYAVGGSAAFTAIITALIYYFISNITK